MARSKKGEESGEKSKKKKRKPGTGYDEINIGRVWKKGRDMECEKETTDDNEKVETVAWSLLDI